MLENKVQLDILTEEKWFAVQKIGDKMIYPTDWFIKVHSGILSVFRNNIDIIKEVVVMFQQENRHGSNLNNS